MLPIFVVFLSQWNKNKSGTIESLSIFNYNCTWFWTLFNKLIRKFVMLYPLLGNVIISLLQLSSIFLAVQLLGISVTMCVYVCVSIGDNHGIRVLKIKSSWILWIFSLCRLFFLLEFLFSLHRINSCSKLSPSFTLLIGYRYLIYSYSTLLNTNFPNWRHSFFPECMYVCACVCAKFSRHLPKLKELEQCSIYLYTSFRHFFKSSQIYLCKILAITHIFTAAYQPLHDQVEVDKI